MSSQLQKANATNGASLSADPNSRTIAQAKSDRRNNVAAVTEYLPWLYEQDRNSIDLSFRIGSYDNWFEKNKDLTQVVKTQETYNVLCV